MINQEQNLKLLYLTDKSIIPHNIEIQNGYRNTL